MTSRESIYIFRDYITLYVKFRLSYVLTALYLKQITGQMDKFKKCKLSFAIKSDKIESLTNMLIMKSFFF